MYHKLTDRVFYGNWESPFELNGQVGTIINVAHNFNVRRGRGIYWQRLAELRHDVLYFRIARKDRENVDDEYMHALTSAVDTALTMNRLPILTHCQLGGHRGPSAGLFAAWHIWGQFPHQFEELHQKVLQLTPGLARGRNYYHSLVAWCKQNAH